MKPISFIPMIKNKLASEFCFNTILNNPRISEVDDILIEIAKNYGTMLEPYILTYSYYQGKLQDRAYHLLYESNIIQVIDGKLTVTMPERSIFGRNYTKTETIEYDLSEDGNLKRTHIITESGGDITDKQSVSVSIINEDGIEIKRKTDIREGRNSKTLIYERIERSPNIVRRTKDGINEEVFYDMTDSRKFETLTALKETIIAKEEVKPISSEQQKTIIENNKYSDYIKGIEKIIGKEKAVSVEDNTER